MERLRNLFSDIHKQEQRHQKQVGLENYDDATKSIIIDNQTSFVHDESSPLIRHLQHCNEHSDGNNYAEIRENNQSPKDQNSGYFTKRVFDSGNTEEPKLDLAHELNQLSIKERENVLHDIHGVSDKIQETDPFLFQSLHAMEMEIQRRRRMEYISSTFSSSSPSAYELANNINKDYILNPKFRLMFLRAESFDINRSVTRFLRFFQLKLELFGKGNLCKDITWNDLDDETRAFVSNGHAQILPARDQAGRAILVQLPEYFPQVSHITAVRFFFVIFPTYTDGRGEN